MRKVLSKLKRQILVLSLIQANRSRGEQKLKKELIKMGKDLSDQYSTFKLDMNDQYWANKIWGQHTFQVSLALKAIRMLTSRDNINIVDIGDSSGHHLQHINEMLKDKAFKLKTLSVNLDPIAINKIQEKGMEAIKCRAEELHLQSKGLEVDVFLSF